MCAKCVTILFGTMSIVRIRITKVDDKGRYVSHNVKHFEELENRLLRENRPFFFTPLIGYYRRKTLRFVINAMRKMTK